jgi:serine/threonine protein phosphatase 1
MIELGLSDERRKATFRIPEGVSIYAIGDVHGRSDLLDRLFSRIDDDLVANPVRRPIHVFLGDYIDRGPDSCGVLDRLIQRAETHEAVFLKGNHELFLHQFLREPATLAQWRQYGGLDTLMSYGVASKFNADADELSAIAERLGRALPMRHRHFLSRLLNSYSCGDFFFAHAGVRPNVALDQQREQDLLWIRDEFLNYQYDFGKIVVHGHTPVDEPDIRPNRINIDTGAYATGKLTCLILEQDKRWFI